MNAALETVLFRLRPFGANEAKVQEQIAEALTSGGVEFKREVKLSPKDRIDFLVGTVGIEVKVKGRTADVEAQLLRYAASDRITELVLITARAQHAKVALELNGKPVWVERLYRGIRG